MFAYICVDVYRVRCIIFRMRYEERERERERADILLKKDSLTVLLKKTHTLPPSSGERN